MADRLLGPLQSIARHADPLISYRCMYRARVLAQSGDLLRLDLEPEDPLVPLMSNIPIRHGIPGLTVKMAPGAYVLVGWENGRPSAPFCGLWANPSTTGAGDARALSGKGGGAVLEEALVAGLLELGRRGGTEALPMFESYRTKELRVDATILAFCQAVTLAIAGDSAISPPLKAAVSTMMAELNKVIVDFNTHFFFSELVRNG